MMERVLTPSLLTAFETTPRPPTATPPRSSSLTPMGIYLWEKTGKLGDLVVWRQRREHGPAISAFPMRSHAPLKKPNQGEMEDLTNGSSPKPSSSLLARALAPASNSDSSPFRARPPWGSILYARNRPEFVRTLPKCQWLFGLWAIATLFGGKHKIGS